MITVPRHDLDLPHFERAVARLTARRHEAREDIETDTRGPGFALDRSYREFACRCAADGRAAGNETWLAMVRALQAGGALFLTACRSADEQVEFRYGEDVIRRPATGLTWDSDALTWLRVLYLAIVARDRPRLELLAGVPIDLLRESGPEYEDFTFAWVHALQVFVRGGDGLVDAVLAALRGVETATRTVAKARDQLYFPPMELFYHYTQREPAAFTESLRTALELHRNYWRTEEPRSDVSVVALAPLAMACLARDAGMPVDVESDYLPHHLLAGTRVGELTT